MMYQGSNFVFLIRKFWGLRCRNLWLSSSSIEQISFTPNYARVGMFTTFPVRLNMSRIFSSVHAPLTFMRYLDPVFRWNIEAESNDQQGYLATILTTSSSATICPNPTRCGTCLALAPHTKAYLNVSLRVRWTWSQTSSMVDPFRTMSASEKSGSMPFLHGKLEEIGKEVKDVPLCVYSD